MLLQAQQPIIQHSKSNIQHFYLIISFNSLSFIKASIGVRVLMSKLLGLQLFLELAQHSKDLN
jgi:hypothetical protein